MHLSPVLHMQDVQLEIKVKHGMQHGMQHESVWEACRLCILHSAVLQTGLVPLTYTILLPAVHCLDPVYMTSFITVGPAVRVYT